MLQPGAQTRSGLSGGCAATISGITRFGERLEGGGVAKKLRHVDEEIVRKAIEFRRLGVELLDVARGLGYARHRHAPLDPAR